MAKRKRLSPAAVLAEPGNAAEPPRPTTRAPIAEVAGAASAHAALGALTREMEEARATGRLIEDIPIEAVSADHLLRDRIAPGDGDDEMTSLKTSLATRGQQVPIEVTDLGPEHAPCRYGLISGWRRLAALRALHAETGEARFATVRALLRKPDGAAEAYLSMVEENEIRVGLSYYERARVAARAAEAGVFEDETAAIRTLFASASKAKRSKIGSFVALYRALDDHLAWPAEIPERLGLKVARALSEGRGGEIRAALMKAAPGSAEAELAALARAVAPPKGGAKGGGQEAAEIVPGIRLRRGRSGLTLAGPGVDAALEEALAEWLRARRG